MRTGAGRTATSGDAKRSSAGVHSANAATVNARRWGAVRQVARAATAKKAAIANGVPASARAVATYTPAVSASAIHTDARGGRWSVASVTTTTKQPNATASGTSAPDPERARRPSPADAMPVAVSA